MIRKSYGSIIAKEIITEWNTEKYYKRLAERERKRKEKDRQEQEKQWN